MATRSGARVAISVVDCVSAAVIDRMAWRDNPTFWIRAIRQPTNCISRTLPIRSKL